MPTRLLVPGAPSIGSRLRRVWLPSSSLALLGLNSRWVCEGDSITAGSNGPQWSQFAIAATGGRLFMPLNWNQAVGGQTAAQMATQLAATLAPLPKLVCLLAGTNDLGGTTDTPAAIYANLLTCVKGYLDGGTTYVVISRVLPRNDTTWNALGSQPQREADRQTLNGLIANMPNDSTLIAAGYAGRVVVAPSIESTIVPATDMVDGLHPNYLGAIKLGQSFAGGINSILNTSSLLTDLYTDSSNLILAASKNPQFTGTTGTLTSTAGGSVTGQAATSWTVSENGGMTVVASKTTLNGATAQRMVISGTNTLDNKVVNLTTPVSTSGAIGDSYEFAVDFSLASGTANLRNLVLTAGTTGNTPNNGNQTVQLDGAGALSGTLRTSVQAQLAGTVASVTLQCIAEFKAGTVAADITWGRPYLRKVPAGQ